MARRGRLSRRENQELVNKAHRTWGAIAGKPEVAERFVTQLKPVRHRNPASHSVKPLEREVLKAVMRALRADPRVANVERNQSGVFKEGNRYIRVGTRGKLDITVYLHSGRFAEIEVKRPGGKPEPHQAERIAAIKANGGISGYCWSAESALALLP